MKPRELSHWLVRALDLLAVIALIGTAEIQSAVSWSVPFAMALAWSVSNQAKHSGLARSLVGLMERLLVWALVAMVLGSVALVRMNVAPPLIVAANASMLVHMLTWFSVDNLRNRNWRLGIAFIGIVLAVSISPDFYLAIVLFLFVVVSALALFCFYLEREFEKRSDLPLPLNFYSQALMLTLLIFILSLVIFPILPRPKQGVGFRGGAGEETQIGYTDIVDLGGNKFWGEQKRSAPVLRVFLSKEWVEPDALRYLIPGYLLRGTALEKFDGTKWFRTTHAPVGSNQRPDGADIIANVEFIREPVGTPTVFVPYSTARVRLADFDQPTSLEQLSHGEWRILQSEHQQVRYVLSLKGDEGRLRLSDTPHESLSEFPSEWAQNPRIMGRWKELAGKIFSDATSNEQKIQSLIRHFASENYEGALVGDRISGYGNSARHNLEHFLFDIKKGHCEYFSTSAALLLRLAGVPARLVSGFRLTSNPVAGVLTVRQSDSHAWIEAWDPILGWTPIDITPMYLAQTWSGFQVLEGARDLLDAYWYRYVISARWIITLWPYFLAAFVLVVLSLWGYRRMRGSSFAWAQSFAFPFRFSSGSKGSNFSLWRRRRRFEGLAPLQYAPDQCAWIKVYDQLRFGRVLVGGPEWKEGLRRLDELFARLRSSVRNASQL
ncbi:MAG: DUF3488 and transglutaminase-like domain-containing protein [Bdellovibrionota bacterium]